MVEVHIEPNDAGQRLDKFLSKTYPDLKKSAMYKAIRNKKIKVNRKRASFDQILQPGDTLLLFLPGDLLTGRTVRIQPPKPLEIVYEDDEIVAVNKPAGLLSMKDSKEDQDTLNDRLLSWLWAERGYDPAREHSFSPSIAHRLDRNTSGLVLAGKTAQGARALAEAIASRTIRKYYLAVTSVRPPEGKIDLYLKKEGTRALVRSRPCEGYDPASMTIHPLLSKNGRWLSEIELHTGRFHQIRASLGFLGCPLCGDVKYGGKKEPGGYQLQAWKIDLSRDSGLKAGTIELPDSKRIHL